jgi:hypothetical protein
MIILYIITSHFELQSLIQTEGFPQMISWLSRQEEIASFEVYLSAIAKIH